MRILLATWGSHGDVNPYLGLAVALKARGHQPVLATLPAARLAVEAAGIEFRPAGPLADPDDRELVRRVMDPRKGGEYLLDQVLFPAVPRWYEELDAAAEGVDAIVSHTVTYPAPLVAERRGLPWLSGILSPVSFFSVHDFPVFPHAAGRGPLSRTPWVNRLLLRLVHRMAARWQQPVHDLRARLGLPPAPGAPLFEGQFSPHGTLAMYPGALGAPQPDWPPHVTRTGAVFHDAPNGAERLPPALEAYLAAGPPPVVFTLGTSAVAAPGAFYRESLEAVLRLGVRAVLLIGRFPDNRPAGRLPESVFVADSVRHSLLFPRAAVVVHQGGAGTVAQALRAGRPQLVVPHAHDQPDHAWRLTRLGVAEMLAPRRYTASRVAEQLGRLLTEPGYERRAAAIATEVQAERGAAAACEALEALGR